MKNRIRNTVLLLVVGAAAFAPAASHALTCSNVPFGPHGNLGVVCTQGTITVGAEVNSSASVLGGCYTGGVGVCPIKDLWINAGSSSPIHVACTGAGFTGDQLRISINGSGPVLDISDQRLYQNQAGC